MKREYIARMRLVVEHLHNCSATWLRSEHVKEEFGGKTIWDGEVEVFGVTGHPKAQRCYGWSYGDPEEFITILELPPVDSSEAAVKVGVAYQIKKSRRKK